MALLGFVFEIQWYHNSGSRFRVQGKICVGAQKSTSILGYTRKVSSESPTSVAVFHRPISPLHETVLECRGVEYINYIHIYTYTRLPSG